MKLSPVTLKTKELGRGGKHPPPVLHQPKKPGANRVKWEFSKTKDTSTIRSIIPDNGFNCIEDER